MLSTPTAVAVGSAGQRQPGAIVAALVCFPLIVRVLLPGVSVLDLADAAVPAVSIAFILVRVGCFLSGCCYGTISDLPWAVHYGVGSPALANHIERGLVPVGAAESLLVHPLAAYFGLAALVTAAVTYWYFPYRQFAGEVVLIGLTMREGSKALLEVYRQPEIGAMSPLHLQAVSGALAVAAAVILIAVRLSIRARTSRPAQL
jgi:phosphatidylglycerol:prolipoprotein diacylglycerol transferase